MKKTFFSLASIVFLASGPFATRIGLCGNQRPRALSGNHITVTGAPADQALSSVGPRRILELTASNTGAVKNPCGPQPETPRPIGRTHGKNSHLSPAVVTPCRPSNG